jgi:hypothetical protein
MVVLYSAINKQGRLVYNHAGSRKQGFVSYNRLKQELGIIENECYSDAPDQVENHL